MTRIAGMLKQKDQFCLDWFQIELACQERHIDTAKENCEQGNDINIVNNNERANP